MYRHFALKKQIYNVFFNFIITAMKVHISQASKELLEDIGGYTFSFRGYTELKVSFITTFIYPNQFNIFIFDIKIKY